MSDLSEHEKEVNYRFTVAYEGLRQARIIKGKSDFSEKIKMPASYYSKFEKNERAIPDYVLDNLSQIFGVNKNWVLTGHGDVFTGKGEVFTDKPETLDKKDEGDVSKPKQFTPKNKSSTMNPSWESQFSKNAGPPSIKPNMELFSRWLYTMNKTALESPSSKEGELVYLKEEVDRLKLEVDRLNKELVRAKDEIIELLRKK